MICTLFDMFFFSHAYIFIEFLIWRHNPTYVRTIVYLEKFERV